LGCRRWLVVSRNNLTHEVLSVVPAHERSAAQEDRA
jgi:sarcosine oxidase delta subunit